MQTQENGSPAKTAQRILGESPYHELRRLKCQYRGGVLTVAGRLSSFFLRQVAQTAVQDLDGVSEIDYRIEVLS